MRQHHPAGGIGKLAHRSQRIRQMIGPATGLLLCQPAVSIQVGVCPVCQHLGQPTLQVERIKSTLKELAARDGRVTRLVHLPEISLMNALTILATIGTIDRFSSPKQLVGYSGLGGRLHASGQPYRAGRITKAGRRDPRTAVVEAAHTASNTHPHWKSVLDRLEPRLGHNKAIVEIARKLLVAVWHVRDRGDTDRFAEPGFVARKLLNCAYLMGKANRPSGLSTAEFVRQHLDALGLGSELGALTWSGSKPPVPLPPSTLA